MTAKDYLSQAYRIDRMVKAKLEQVRSLRDLATNATTTLSHTPPTGTRNVHRMEDIIAKMVDIEMEVNADIDALVDLKRDIMATIKAVENDDYRTLLELRYLCFKSWETIAADMSYNINSIFKLHRKALEHCKVGSKSSGNTVV